MAPSVSIAVARLLNSDGGDDGKDEPDEPLSGVQSKTEHQTEVEAFQDIVNLKTEDAMAYGVREAANRAGIQTEPLYDYTSWDAYNMVECMSKLTAFAFLLTPCILCELGKNPEGGFNRVVVPFLSVPRTTQRWSGGAAVDQLQQVQVHTDASADANASN